MSLRLPQTDNFLIKIFGGKSEFISINTLASEIMSTLFCVALNHQKNLENMTSAVEKLYIPGEIYDYHKFLHPLRLKSYQTTCNGKQLPENIVYAVRLRRNQEYFPLQGNKP